MTSRNFTTWLASLPGLRRSRANRTALAQLAAEGRRLELAYIDGSHHRADVPADSFATWPLIVPGGIVIWDDYEWRRH